MSIPYFLLAMWEVILPERSEKQISFERFEGGGRGSSRPAERSALAIYMDREMLRRLDPNYVYVPPPLRPYEQRRRQWDEEASQPIKE